MSRTHVLTPETIESYQRLGAVVLRGVFNAQEIQTLEQGIEHNLAHLSDLVQVASQPNDPGRFVEDFCTWQSNPDYQSILCHSTLPHLAAQLMQSQTVRLYHDHLLVKEPGTKQATPWHQDQPYYNVSGRQNVSFWIPVDPVPLASTLRLWRNRIWAPGTCLELSETSKPNGFQREAWLSCHRLKTSPMNTSNLRGPLSQAIAWRFRCCHCMLLAV